MLNLAIVGAYSSTKSKRSLAACAIFACTEMTASGYISKASPRQIELIKKDLCGIFSSYGPIEANKETTSSMSPSTCLTGKTCLTPNPEIPLYVNRKSNHPLCIIENIPKSINKRLSEISIDEHSAPLYQKALDDSGYNHRLTFTPNLRQSSSSIRKKPPAKHHLVQSTV